MSYFKNKQTNKIHPQGIKHLTLFKINLMQHYVVNSILWNASFACLKDKRLDLKPELIKSSLTYIVKYLNSQIRVSSILIFQISKNVIKKIMS